MLFLAAQVDPHTHKNIGESEIAYRWIHGFIIIIIPIKHTVLHETHRHPPVVQTFSCSFSACRSSRSRPPIRISSCQGKGGPRERKSERKSLAFPEQPGQKDTRGIKSTLLYSSVFVRIVYAWSLIIFILLFIDTWRTSCCVLLVIRQEMFRHRKCFE